ncbi:DEAD/DEAH box helicase family protein [Mucilaginibacter daejeonensis]|uniref:DEAD/DEAH box helicase family protein n=1 Tax=Mucilaginibacter daejeonensis TaxID=398049 RepID=UPI001D179DF4|nr:DEAD/DEAH box helicase family protein [Mucilaginibacter daejeonensis]UEG52589.1 DEAD/DEAH box helicase family protein [Mucilaginibacter daejeonensis]
MLQLVFFMLRTFLSQADFAQIDFRAFSKAAEIPLIHLNLYIEMYTHLQEYTISKEAYLDTVFNSIPSNAFIDKGRCGIGGTTLELLNKTRCSIIVAPTRGILRNKKLKHPDLFIIDGDVNRSDIEEYLQHVKPASKIMVTPDSFGKLIDALKARGLYETALSTWFLLLDECHSFITEAFRKNILKPFQYFWAFTHKAIISATPYHFSNPRFKQLAYYKINFTASLGTVTLVQCYSIKATLNALLARANDASGNIHIFYNSVTAIAQAIKLAGLTNLSIYCADDKDKTNMEKLGEYAKYYHELPDNSNSSKVNFYTCKYFEGIDIEDKDAVVVVVTDVNQPHTKVPVNMKLKQAVGRLRDAPEQIIHLTNHHRRTNIKRELSEIQQQFKAEADLLIKQRIEYLELCTNHALKPKPDDLVARYADIDAETGYPTFNYELFDQVVNEVYSNEIYNDINLIRGDWEAGYYDVIMKRSDLKSETSTAMKRKSKATILKEDIEALKAYKLAAATAMIFNFGHTVETEIRKRNPLAYEAERVLSMEKLEELKYNRIKVQQEVIIASNLQVEHKLLKLLNSTFQVGQRYSIEVINERLQTIYEKLNIRDAKGNVRKAQATDLGEPGRFRIHLCKIQGSTQNAYDILGKNFGLQIAA